MKQRSGNDIRKEYLEFFRERGHTFVPSSSLLPADDPTLLFANAGMNQFKPLFLGTETRDYARAVNSQKCIRAGGKHNDLEDVGHDTYHHTFFEMLGNWSFGDYFKAEAIAWAWELLTDVWQLPRDRLHVTVFEGDASEGLQPDDEARRLWTELTDVDPDNIHNGNKKDNFWEMGDTGPCGPCSEIHIDLTPEKTGRSLVNADSPQVIELWNLVFIQFNRLPDGSLQPLPAKHVDTGMGFERIAMVLQGKRSNYATDVFVPLIEAIEGLTDHRYGASSGLDDRFDVAGEDDMGDVACRVIADHARTLTFAIADGILPSNDGRGYVLRRILRRACRYGRQYLGIEGGFLTRLVPTIIEQMGEAFAEIVQRRQAVTDVIAQEEESFGRTLDRGIDLFQKQARRLKKSGASELPGEVAFDLYATYGFPVDLTEIMAGEEGLTVDLPGYETAMEAHRQTSAAGGDAFKAEALVGLPSTDDSPKYDAVPVEATVLGWVADGAFVEAGRLAEGCQAAVVLDRTGFYAERGGQVGDRGALLWSDGGRFEVRDAKVAGSCVLHVGEVVCGELTVGQAVRAELDPSRRDTQRNHTATHLLNFALREELGEGVDQAGSVVAPDRLRFDFTHGQALGDEQLRRVERRVNELVLADEPVGTTMVPLDTARQIPGVRAMFGEKYPDPVRVVSVGTADPLTLADATRPVEFCGGTHLSRTSQIGLFKIVSEESVAKGVRRITALTGTGAVEWAQQADALLKAASGVLRVPPEGLAERAEALQKELKQLRKRPAGGAGGGEAELREVARSPAGPVLVGKVAGGEPGAMRSVCDRERQKGAGAILLGGTDDEKVTLVAMVSEELVSASGVKAGDWIRHVTERIGGRGGGKPTMAQGGAKDPARLDEALGAAGEWVHERLA